MVFLGWKPKDLKKDSTNFSKLDAGSAAVTCSSRNQEFDSL